MTLDLSEVKKIAVQCGAEKIVKSFKSMNEVFYLTEFSEVELMKFAQAIYAVGAAEQKEKDAKICEQFYSIEGIAQSCSEAIRYNE